MAAQIDAPRPKTLADLYVDRDLSQGQVRRLVALLGLAAPPGGRVRDEEKAAGAA